MIAVESLRAGNLEDYSKLFIEIPFPIKKSGLHLQPGGEYVRAFYKDPICPSYQKIFDFARERGLSLSRYSYETIINETVIDRAEDAIVQIEIPATRRKMTSYAANRGL